MLSKWIGCIHKGQVGKRQSLREQAHRHNPENQSCNAGRREYTMRVPVEFRTELTEEDWPSSVQRGKLLSVSTKA